MTIGAFGIGKWPTAIWNLILDLDNHIIGLCICIFAVIDWMAFYDGANRVSVYYSQGLYGLPSLNLFSIFTSAIYLTLAGIILLSLRRPLSRYRSVLPNFVAVFAAFLVYVFVWVPSGHLLGVSVYVGLLFVALGAVIIITSLFFLRQAFSVTPQARFLVTAGPYSIIRHPMYLGNLVSLLGLALLIDSVEAVALFFVCSGLQMCRALYEEKLLQSNFSEYASYKLRVGGFFPRLNLARPVAAALILFAAACYFVPDSAVATMRLTTVERGSNSDDLALAGSRIFDANETERHAANGQLVLVAESTDQWAQKCDAWYRKAKAGNWFTKADADEFAKTITKDADTTLKRIPSCKPFTDLQWQCNLIELDWDSHSISDKAYIARLEAADGCAAIVGYDNVCTALEDISKKGIKLDDSMRGLMVNCIVTSIRNERVPLLRPLL
jgi:protein-S-isoprenylcysteine O-methyltransferase Ste14